MPPPRGQAAQAREREALLIRLRRDGATFQQIADHLGYSSASNAHRAYRRAMERIPAVEAAEYRALALQRLEALWQVTWEKAQALGDPAAVRACVRILERQARLLGLDAPTNLRVSDGLDGEIEALLAEMQRLTLAEATLSAEGEATAAAVRAETEANEEWALARVEEANRESVDFLRSVEEQQRP